MRNYQNPEQEYHRIHGSLPATLLVCCIRCQDFLHIHVLRDLCVLIVLDCIKFKLFVMLLCHMRSSFSMPLLYHAYVYLEFLILACTIYILAPYVSQLFFLQPTGRRGTFLSEEQICNLLWHSQPIVNCVN